MTTPPAAPPTAVFEIRVHGVNNSPPAEMLETTPDGIRRVTGDGAGTFWRRLRDRPQDGVARVEAYSWGEQTRTGGGALAVVGTALVHLGWFLLLPYALVNLAYWCRRIPPQSPERKAWRGGAGAGSVRLFGLVLTLIATTAFTTVAVEIVALQCFRAVDGVRQVCAALPGPLDALAGWSADGRAAAFGLLPIVAMGVLYLLVRRARVGFEPALDSFGRTMADEDEPGRPLLSTPGFWTAARVRDTSEWLHLAAAVFAVVFLLAERSDQHDPWRAGFEVAAGVGVLVCAVGVVLATSTPPKAAAPAADRSADPASSAGAGRLRMVAGMLSERRSTSVARTARKRSYAFWSLVVAGVVYAGWCAMSALRRPDTAAPTGLIAAPTVLVAVALFLALWALSFDRGRGMRVVGLALLVVAGSCFVATLVWPGGLGAGVVTSVGMACVGAHVAVSLSPRRGKPGNRRNRGDARNPRGTADGTLFEAWHGRGAAVAMLLALLASLSLSSLLVLGVSAAVGVVPPVGSDRMFRVLAAPLRDAEWSIPDAYEKAAVVLTLVVVATLVVLAAAGLRLLRAAGLRRFTLPDLDWRDPGSLAARHEFAEDEESGVMVAPAPDYPPAFDDADPDDPAALTGHLHAEARAKRRRISHLAHRGEPLFAWIAGVTAVGLLVLVAPGAVELVRLVLEHVAPGSPTAVRVAAVSVLGIVAVAAVAKVVTDAVSSRDRPLGTFWDVVGFFPRAGHPFAPPCFAERCVPELAARVRGLVRDEKHPVDVLLSAHSMGSTISAATILALRGEPDGRGALVTDHLALLTFGSQLRGYFSRFFPSVLGPDILGVPGLRGPSLWAADPWHAQVRAEFGAVAPPQAAPPRTSLRGILTRADPAAATPAAAGVTPGIVPPPRWRNLWRRTDFLGFPVYGYPSAENPVDRGASETPPGYLWMIATHSPYLGLDQFRLARRELAEALSARRP